MAFDFARLARQPRLLAMRAGLVVVLTFLAVTSVPSFSGVWAGARAGADLAETAGLLILAAAVVLTPLIVAGSISSEREKGTLELLIVSGADARSVLVGKFVSHAATAVLLTLAGLPIAFTSGFLGGVEPDRIPVLAANASVVAFYAAALTFMATANSASTLPAVFSAFGKLVVFSVGSLLLAGWAFAFLMAPWIARLVIFGLFALTILFVWIRPGALVVRLGCLGVFILFGAILFFAMMAASHTFRRYVAIPPVWEWVLSVLCPWVRFYEDAIGQSVPWPQRFVAWGSHLALSAWFLQSAARRFELELPAAARRPDGPGAAAYARFMLRESLRNVMAARRGFDAEAPRRSRIDPHAAASEHRKNAFSALPVWSDPIFWKETAWRRIPDLEKTLRFAYGLSGLFLALSFLPAGDCGRWEGFHWGIFLQLGMAALFVTVLAAALFASEREAGTLPVLLSTGFSPLGILAGKVKAVCWWLRPLLILVGIHLVLIGLDLGECGIFAAVVASAILLDAGALGLLASTLAPNFRTAVVVGVLLVAAMLGAPPVWHHLKGGHRYDLGPYDSLGLIADLLDSRELTIHQFGCAVEFLAASLVLCVLAGALSRNFLMRTGRP
jgi:ABC-type transport system involved in multi-copper enzyme maturation permease subunit